MQTLPAATRIVALTGLFAAGLSAQFLPYGQACAGTAGVPTLVPAPGHRLQTGWPYSLRVTNIPANAPATLLLGLRRWTPGVDLGVIGMEGCRLHHSAEFALPMRYIGSGAAAATIPLPAFPCLTLYGQAVVLDPGANTLGVIASNAATLVLDPVSETHLHRASSANLVANSTYFSEPSINGEPNALLFTTAVWNPGGVGGIYSNHSTGVWYDDTNVRWAVFNQDSAPMPDGASFHVLLPDSAATQFVATASGANTIGHRMVIDHSALNGNPGAIVFAEQNWNPGNRAGVNNDSNIGVWYNAVSARWEVFNQGLAAMPSGASFNILLGDVNLSYSHGPFVHTASVANLSGNWTYLDHPELNGDPAATLTVTQAFGVTNNHPIGVWYDTTANRWAIFNQDQFAIGAGAKFHVLIGEDIPHGKVLAHQASAGNSTGNVTYISDPQLDGNVGALAYCTPNVNPNGGSGTYNAEPIGLFYSSTSDGWAVFNQRSAAAMPIGASFNVLVPNSGAIQFVLTADAFNTTANWVEISHPFVNGNPNAILFVTQNWNPGGGIGVRNQSEIGVFYRTGTRRWNVFRQDGNPMPMGASFNVLIADGRLETMTPPFVHRATPADVSGNATYLDHPDLNGKPGARITVTQNWNPPGSSGVYNDHPIAVFYNAARQQWAIVNQDVAAMRNGAAFNVLIDVGCP